MKGREHGKGLGCDKAHALESNEGQDAGLCMMGRMAVNATRGEYGMEGQGDQIRVGRTAG